MSRYCPNCGKSRKACLCSYIEPLISEVELIILQHPTEENRPLGTARILSLSLANCHRLVGEDFSHHPQLNAMLAEPDVHHFVLYPGPQAQEAASLMTASAIPKGKYRIILLDGTWRKAYKIWQLSQNLQALPTLALPAHLQGDYRIRKAPSDNSLSTVEAGYHILSMLQPERDFRPLLMAFDRMIQFQIDQMPPGIFEKNYSRE